MNLLVHFNPPRCFATTCSPLVMMMKVMTMMVLFRSRNTQAVQETGGNQTVVVGGTAKLPCKTTELAEMLTQISWRRKTREMPENNFFFTISEQNGPSFVNGPDARITYIGNLAEGDGTLQISNVSLNDEGHYTCIFTLFPSGIYETEIPLQLLAPPATSLSYDPHVLGSEEVLLATCTAAGARPPAGVSWLPLVKGLTVRTNSTEHDNGTTTTVSSLFGAPTREISGQKVECVVSSPALSEDQHQSFTLEVYFSPMNVTILEISDNTFECVAEGNPKPSFIWTRSGKFLAESDFRVDGGSLTFLRSISHLKGLYQCEVSNLYGQKKESVYVAVGPGPSNPAPWVLFGLLLSLNVIGAAWYFYKNGHFKRANNEAHSVSHRVPTDSDSPEMVPVSMGERDRSSPAEV